MCRQRCDIFENCQCWDERKYWDFVFCLGKNKIDFLEKKV